MLHTSQNINIQYWFLLALQVHSADTRPFLPSVPPSLSIMIIHGTKDCIIHYSESNYLTELLKNAVHVAIDPSQKTLGSIPSRDYGHSWYEYFEAQVCVDVIQTFTKGGVGLEGENAKL